MKRILTISLAVLLLASTAVVADPSVDQFIEDAEIVKIAPHLVQEILSDGVEAASNHDALKETAGNELPMLNDIVEIISSTIFQPGAQDWSRLETARLQAIEKHGDENVKKWADLNEMDTRRAVSIVNTIYDAVLNFPPVTAEMHKANKEAAKSSNFWDFLGASLVNTADLFKKAKGIVAPAPACETANKEYLKGVEDVVYYSALTHGLTGSLLVAAPDDAAIKSVEMKDIVEAVSKLSIEMQMAQSIARLSGLKPEDDAVRLMSFLGLAAISPSSNMALSARDIYALVKQGLDQRIPPAVVSSLKNQAALLLVTKGAGEQGNKLSAENAPILRNLVAFSSDVLTSNNIGDTLEYVFCPDQNNDEHTAAAEVKEDSGEVVQEPQDKIAEVTDETQKSFEAPKGAAPDAAAAEKEAKAQDPAAGDAAAAPPKEPTEAKAPEAVPEAAPGDAAAEEIVIEETSKKVEDATQETKEDIQDPAQNAEKPAEGAKKVNEDAKPAESVKDATEEVEKKAHQEL